MSEQGDRILGDAVRHSLRLLALGGTIVLITEILRDAVHRAEEADRRE